MKYIPLFSSIFPSTPHFLASISIQSITPLIFRKFSTMASWPSLSNPSNQEAAIRKRSTGSQFKFFVAPIYAYVLPHSRLSLGKNSVVRLPFVYLCVGGSICSWLLFGISFFYGATLLKIHHARRNEKF